MLERDDFINFLIKAKKATYASQGDNASVTAFLEGSKQLEFQEGEFFYRDIYFGMKYFVGQEVVYYNEKPIWSMCYSGGVLNHHHNDFISAIYHFLRKALRNVPVELPFRGPKEYVEDSFIYMNNNSGSLNQFEGIEVISFENNSVYSLIYSGGFIR